MQARTSVPRPDIAGRHYSPGGAGLTLAMVSAATFGTSGTFALSLIGAGWTPAAAVTARVTVAALVLTIPAVIQLRGRWSLLWQAGGRVAAYGLVAVAGCQLCFFSAVQRVPVGVALLLEYLGAVLVVGWLWLRHGQRPRRLTVAGALTAIAGLAMVLNLAGSSRINYVGVLWGLLAAVGLATYFLLSAAGSSEPSARSGTPSGEPAGPLPPVAMAWGAMCIGAAALWVFGWAGLLQLTAPDRDVTLLGHQVSWVVPVLGLSVVAAVVPYVAGIGAARRLGAKLASFIGMFEVLFAILFAWLVLGQLPSPVQFLGGAFILAGVALVRADEFRTGRAPAHAIEPPGDSPQPGTQRLSEPCRR